MPIPAMLATAAPYAIPAALSALGYLFNRKGGRGQQQYMQQPQGMGQQGMSPVQTQEIPGVGTATQFGRFGQQQQDFLSQMLPMALQSLQSAQSPTDIEPILQQARTGFQQQTIPGIAERFTQMGAQDSSAFPQALGAAGAGLEESLAALKAQIGLQEKGRFGQLGGMLSQLGLQPQFETGFVPKGNSLFGSLAGGLGQGAGMLAPLLAMKYFG